MGKALFILAVFLLSFSLAGAQSRYRGFVDAGYGPLFGDKSGSVYQASTSHGVLFGNIFIGGGIGCDYYSVNNPDYDPDYVIPEESMGWGMFQHTRRFTGFSFPVFLNIKALWEDKPISPAFDLKGGISTGFALGLFGEIGAGCRFALSGQKALLVNAFYKHAYELNGMVTDDSDSCEGRFANAGIKVAFEF